MTVSTEFRATATLEAERVAFENEKAAHTELYEEQQKVCLHGKRGSVCMLFNNRNWPKC